MAIELPPPPEEAPATDDLSVFSFYDLHLLQAALNHEMAIRIAAGQRTNGARVRSLLYLIEGEIEDRSHYFFDEYYDEQFDPNNLDDLPKAADLIQADKENRAT